MRAKERRASDEPSVTKSSALKADPRRVIPYKDMELPRRPKERIASFEPMVT
jgi:hypothetical protein